MKKKVDIIVPCYNPPDGWEERFSEITGEIRMALPQYKIHLILVDDGSQKNFNEKQIQFLTKNIRELKIVQNKINSGKGHSIRQGLKQASGDFIIYTDSDFPYGTESIVRLLAYLEEGNDIVFGVRPPSYYSRLPAQRRIISRLFQIFNRFILRLPIADTQCGLKGLRASAKRTLSKTKIKHYLFDLEFMALASHEPKLKISTINVRVRSGLNVAKLKVSVLLRETINLIKLLLRLMVLRVKS